MKFGVSVFFPVYTCWIGCRVLSAYWWVQPFCFFSGQNSRFHVSDQKEGKQLWIKHAGIIPLLDPYLTALMGVWVCANTDSFQQCFLMLCFLMLLLSMSAGYSLDFSVCFNHFSPIFYLSLAANSNRLCKYMRLALCNRLFSIQVCCGPLSWKHTMTS